MHVARLESDVWMPVELVWREDDDSPVLARLLEVATPSPSPGPAPAA
jgi:hypothetical protein